jgi:hypothetical protein
VSTQWANRSDFPAWCDVQFQPHRAFDVHFLDDLGERWPHVVTHVPGPHFNVVGSLRLKRDRKNDQGRG